MSVACKCERCGEFYIPNNNDEAYVPVNGSLNTFNAITLERWNYKTDGYKHVGFTSMDVCPECAASFDNWWNEPNPGK